MSHWKHSSTERPLGGITVERGDLTGCYYLLMSNLQKATEWSDVKDFLRNGNVDMDHVEVFPGSYSGWVRIFGRQNFDAAVDLFRTKPYKGQKVTVDDSNATRKIWLRNLKIAPLEAPAASIATYGAAFAAQIPPFLMSQQSGYMPSNMSMFYTNPYVTSPGTAYGVLNDYEQTPLEYNKAHPTHYHDAAPVQRTGYEGTQLYANSSRAFMENFESMSLQSPGGETRNVTSADFKIQVKLHREGDTIYQGKVLHFVRSCAPVTVQNVLRIDILKRRVKHRGPPNRALIVFNSAQACAIARSGMFNKEVSGMRLIQDATDDSEPAVQADPEAAAKESASGKGKEHVKPLVVVGTSLAAKPLVVCGSTPLHKQKHDQKKQQK
ncbi:hypothetical protein CONLIGDRAFT_673182 [Coniochaeta ligniaria NRRL 30616]|uniref:RRM domain-containing protein n=1 Tax=Coniochaeta ligniaria NRRL 30616 TaxID=1408157 RepID=A0A1J7J564_9PEZI|nr:hypothetical protein CONLIGDRAFT_673182 [Coniochaeta ligniaria NRRL 30616]